MHVLTCTCSCHLKCLFIEYMDMHRLRQWVLSLGEGNLKIGSIFVAYGLLTYQNLYRIIAELAECSPIFMQNISNPSSRKNLDVRPYKVLLLTCVVNCTAGTPTPRLCPVVQWSVHWAPSRTTRVLVLAGARRCALETCGKKKMRAPLLGLAKSLYYI